MRMKILIPIFMILWSRQVVGCAAQDQTLTIHDAWARPSDAGGNSAAYMRLEGGARADQLLGVHSPSATLSELHQTSVDADGTARMEHIGSISIPANSEVELMPGGLHIMLMDLQAPLEVGDSLQLTLQFEDAGEVTIEVPVQ